MTSLGQPDNQPDQSDSVFVRKLREALTVESPLTAVLLLAGIAYFVLSFVHVLLEAFVG